VPAVAGNLAITLGTFTLTDSASAWIDKDFNGLVTFTMPSVITGSNQAQFNAEVTGLVLKNAFGLVYIDFSNSPLHFTFKNDTYAGSFDFSVDDLFFGVLGTGGSNSVDWTGHVTNAQQTKLAASSVPEPSSLLLLGAGALGMFGRLRKKLLN
jgi:hypothetical protein